MSATASWQSVLTVRGPARHIAQLYTDEGFLARAVANFIGDGLRAGEAAVVLARPSHWRAVERQLQSEGFDVDALGRRGQLLLREADTCLAEVLVDGRPDPERFRLVIGGALDAARGAGRPLRVFGELVDLLRSRDVEATIRLEELWNDRLATGEISLLCGYSLDAFDRHVYRGFLQRVCAAHSHLIPVEDYGRLEHAVERAYAEVFGADGDAEALRRIFLASYQRPSAMPDAAAAMLAVREYLPATIDALLETARGHYRTAMLASAD